MAELGEPGQLAAVEVFAIDDEVMGPGFIEQVKASISLMRLERSLSQLVTEGATVDAAPDQTHHLDLHAVVAWGVDQGSPKDATTLVEAAFYSLCLLARDLEELQGYPGPTTESESADA